MGGEDWGLGTLSHSGVVTKGAYPIWDLCLLLSAREGRDVGSSAGWVFVEVPNAGSRDQDAYEDGPDYPGKV